MSPSRTDLLQVGGATTSQQSGDVPLGVIAEAVIRDSTVKSTLAVYDRIADEWKGYCEYISRDRDDDYPLLVNREKVSDFLFFHSFRTRQRNSVRGGASRRFNPEEYESVKNTYQDYYRAWRNDSNRAPIPDPEDGGIGKSAMMQYRAAIKRIYEQQVQRNRNTFSWEHVWSLQSKTLYNIVSHRKTRIDRESCKEKVNKEFAGYHAIDRFEDIEQDFWDASSNTSLRSAFPYMRHRMLFLYTTSGILRCESLMKAELSDFQGLLIEKETDIDPLYVMISQIPEGKFSSPVALCSSQKSSRTISARFT